MKLFHIEKMLFSSTNSVPVPISFKPLPLSMLISVAILAESGSEMSVVASTPVKEDLGKRARYDGTDAQHADLLEEFIDKQSYLAYTEAKDDPVRNDLLVTQKAVMRKLHAAQANLSFKKTSLIKAHRIVHERKLMKIKKRTKGISWDLEDCKAASWAEKMTKRLLCMCAHTANAMRCKNKWVDLLGLDKPAVLAPAEPAVAGAAANEGSVSDTPRVPANTDIDEESEDNADSYHGRGDDEIFSTKEWNAAEREVKEELVEIPGRVKKKSRPGPFSPCGAEDSQNSFFWYGVCRTQPKLRAWRQSKHGKEPREYTHSWQKPAEEAAEDDSMTAVFADGSLGLLAGLTVGEWNQHSLADEPLQRHVAKKKAKKGKHVERLWEHLSAEGTDWHARLRKNHGGLCIVSLYRGAGKQVCQLNPLSLQATADFPLKKKGDNVVVTAAAVLGQVAMALEDGSCKSEDRFQYRDGLQPQHGLQFQKQPTKATAAGKKGKKEKAHKATPVQAHVDADDEMENEEGEEEEKVIEPEEEEIEAEAGGKRSSSSRDTPVPSDNSVALEDGDPRRFDVDSLPRSVDDCKEGKGPGDGKGTKKGKVKGKKASKGDGSGNAAVGGIECPEPAAAAAAAAAASEEVIKTECKEGKKGKGKGKEKGKKASTGGGSGMAALGGTCPAPAAAAAAAATKGSVSSTSWFWTPDEFGPPKGGFFD